LKGLFITFEGPDGSGKTTQLKLFADYLSNKGYDVYSTREPGGTLISDQIRHIVLSPDHNELVDQAEILLYAASRAQLVHEKIIPALEAGKIVLCDRYIDASVAYQAYGLQKDRGLVEQINSFASSNLTPNRTYLFDISIEDGMKRLINRDIKEYAGLDRIEQKEADYHERVLSGFNQLAIEYPNRILKIDGSQSIDDIFRVIREDFEFLINN